MNSLVLDEATLRKGWGGEGQFWFSLKNYTVKDVVELAEYDNPEQISQSAYFVSLGYIPFFVVSNDEVIHAFVNSVKNVKLKNALNKISNDKFTEAFWKYYNVYPEISDSFSSFESNYVIEKAKVWCDENGISYVIQ